MNDNTKKVKSHAETIVSTKDIKDGILYTVARVLKNNQCGELHYNNGCSIIEYGIKVSSDKWENVTEEIDWFNLKLKDDYVLTRLTYLFNNYFNIITPSHDQIEEVNLIRKILSKHKVYDIEVYIDENDSLIAFDDDNYWKESDFYDFLFDELFVYNQEGKVDLLDDKDFKKIQEYRNKYLNRKLIEIRHLDKTVCNMKNCKLYDYLYYVGITTAIPQIRDKDLLELMKICEEVDGDYTDPIELSRALAGAIYVDKYITLSELKNIPPEDIYEAYYSGDLHHLEFYSSHANEKIDANLEAETEK